MNVFLSYRVALFIIIVLLLRPDLACGEKFPEVVVTGHAPVAASSTRVVPGEDFQVRPQGRPADLLRLAPGLVIAQHAGGGKADQQFLRGFDSDHGTDVLITLDGMPINLRSHAHGQGYADTHFIIPETLSALEITKGPYEIRQGDFATAGAVNFVTAETAPDDFIQHGSASFALRRDLLVASPTRGAVKTLVAFESFHNDGPFLHPDGYDRYNGLAKTTLHPTEATDLSLAVTHHTGRWHGSGQIPLREVRAGRLDRFGAIDPSEGGRTDRTTVNLHGTWHPDEQSSWHTQWYYQHYGLDLYSNFTFFKDDRVNGDGIGQFDRRQVYGADLRYQREERPWGVPATGTLGFQARVDDARVRLVHQAQRNTLSLTQAADLLEGSYTPYAELELRPFTKMRLVTGVRQDFFHDQVEDHKPGSTALNGIRSADRLGYTGNLVLGPWARTEYFANYGQGFHSNDARAIILNPALEPLPTARGAEVGARARPTKSWQWTGTLWWLDLDSELVFSGDDGTTEARGRTRRYGWELGTRWTPRAWLQVGGDVTWSHAEFTATGDAVAGAPKLVARGDVTVRTPRGLESSLEVRHLGPRDGVGDRSIHLQGYTVIDWTTRYRLSQHHPWWKHVDLFFAIENLLNRHYREAQFVTETQLQSESSPVQDITFSPGYPRTISGGLRVEF